MSALLEKIKQLQHQQCKVEYLLKVKDFAATLKASEEFPTVNTEVSALVSAVIDTLISKIEQGEALGTANKYGDVHLNSSELSTVKQTTEKAPVATDDRSKKIEFAKQFIAYGGKKIKGTTDEGKSVEGPVVRLEAPFLLVRNDLSEGEIAKVRPENLTA